MENHRLRIETADFNLEAALESGQVFGFKKLGEKTYEGLIEGIPIILRQKENSLHAYPICGNGKAQSGLTAQSLGAYFDLDRDLSPVYERIRSEKRLGPLLPALRGLRIIRQKPWEALGAFILSSNNNIKRIQGIWAGLVSHFGGFPSASGIAQCRERTLRDLGLGYRAPYLLGSAQFLAANPEYLLSVQASPYEEARKKVLAFPGIGEKVADCVLLFGFQKYEAFPVDVWMYRVMKKLYFRTKAVTPKRVMLFGRQRWGPHAGYVQQYIYYAARKKLI